MNIFSGNDEHNHKYHLEVKDIYNDFLLLLFFLLFQNKNKIGKKEEERKKGTLEMGG